MLESYRDLSYMGFVALIIGLGAFKQIRFNSATTIQGNHAADDTLVISESKYSIHGFFIISYRKSVTTIYWNLQDWRRGGAQFRPVGCLEIVGGCPNQKVRLSFFFWSEK